MEKMAFEMNYKVMDHNSRGKASLHKQKQWGLYGFFRKF